MPFPALKGSFEWISHTVFGIGVKIISAFNSWILLDWNDGFAIAAGKIIENGIRIIALIKKKRLWRLLG